MAEIKSVFLFNPLLENKLLYSYPDETGDTQATQSSLLEGVVEFSKFVAQSAGEVVEMTTERFRVIVAEIEPNFFLSIVFNDESDLENSRRIFHHFTSVLFLLHGSITALVEKQYLEVLDDFVPLFVMKNGAVGSNFSQGIKYAPIERHAFIAVYTLGLELQTEFFDVIDDFAILHNNALIATSIENFAPLYSYLCGPFWRFGTPAILPGGGSSSYGRSNNHKSFLFGPTGQGEGVFCPLIYLSRENPKILCMYTTSENLSFLLLLKNQAVSINFFRRLENILVDNNEINLEIMPLLRNNSQKSAGGFANFHNSVNKSVLKESATPNSFWWSKKNDQKHISEFDPSAVAMAVKSSSAAGWAMMRKSNNRQVVAHLPDPKMPLWKANQAMAKIMDNNFSSIFFL